jgi:hypothetical protein
MLELATKVHDEARQGEAFAPFSVTRIYISGIFILKAMAVK